MRIDPLDIVRQYVGDQDGTNLWIEEWSEAHAQRWFAKNTLQRQLRGRRDILAAIESFLLAHWQADGVGDTFGDGPVAELAKRTLAHHLASAEERAQLIEVFELLADNISTRITDPTRRRVFGRTLFGLRDTIALEQWVGENAQAISGGSEFKGRNPTDGSPIILPSVNPSARMTAPRVPSFTGLPSSLRPLRALVGHRRCPSSPSSQHRTGGCAL